MSTIPTEQTQILLASTPNGPLAESHFEVTTAAVPEPRDGEVLVRNILLSLDAANRAWMQGATYKSAVSPGDVMHGGTIGEVVVSRSPDLAAGDVVSGMLGWQQYAAAAPKRLERCPGHRPLTHLMSVLGVAGKTAYHGLLNVAGVAKGETLLVSAAAGSVGSLVGQIGKIRGARVVGIAGGPEKCGWVVDTLGFDACIDYKSQDVRAALKQHAPDGVDVYFDNVGGPILQNVLFAMRERGRIACCGAVSQYDTNTPTPIYGIPGLLVVRRIRMEGFIVYDFASRDEQALTDLSAWVKGGQIRVVEDVLDGLESAPRGLIGLLAGENRGKRMVRIGPDESAA